MLEVPETRQCDLLPVSGSRAAAGPDQFLRTAIIGSAGWLRHDSTPLWTHVDRPEGGAVHGVVVLAPAIGFEALVSERTMRILALELAGSRVACVRFHWTGEGDSAPLVGPDPVEQWRTDLLDVCTYAAGLAPGAPLSVVGLRLGGDLAVSTDLPQVDRIVAWEPIGGRGWLRSSAALRLMSVPVPPVPKDQGTEVCGGLYDEFAARAIRAIPRAQRDSAGSTDVTVRTESAEVVSGLYANPLTAKAPMTSLRELVASVARTTEPVILSSSAKRALPTTTLMRLPDGSTVRESLQPLGPHGLSGVLTRPLATISREGYLFAAPSSDPRHSPVGLFVGAARTLAAHGALCLRADRRGVGELIERADSMAPNPYSWEAIEDVATMANTLRRAGVERVNGIGSCVSGWHLLSAARTSPIDRVMALGNLAWDPDPRRYHVVPGTSDVRFGGRDPGRWLRWARSGPVAGAEGPAPAGQAGGNSASASDRGGRDSPTPRGPVASLVARTRTALIAMARRAIITLLVVASNRGPRMLWRGLAAAGITMDPYAQLSPVPSAVRVQLFNSSDDDGRFTRMGGPRAVSDLLRSGRELEYQHVPELDHALLSHRARTWFGEWVGAEADGLQGSASDGAAS